MWKKLPDSKPLFLSFTKEQDTYNIYITNYIRIWWVCYTDNDFLTVFKKSNDDLEMDSDDQILQLCLKMMREPENLKKFKFTLEGKTLHISMSLTDKFPVYLDIQLTEGSREMFFEKITQQLLKTVHDLRTSESLLRALLLKKDKEIEEYKCETDVRLAMYLKTSVFDDTKHMAKHTIYEKNFGVLDVPKCLLEHKEEKPEDVIVKQEKEDKEFPTGASETDFQPSLVIVKTKQESQVPETNGQSTFSTDTNKREIKSEPLNVRPRKKTRILKI